MKQIRLQKDFLSHRRQQQQMNLSTPEQAAFGAWTRQRSLRWLGTNSGASETLSFQHWRRFKEAFAPELIGRAVSESTLAVNHCVDPFGGSGTTALACHFLGIDSTSIEVNPYLADLIEAKVSKYDLSRVTSSFGGIVDRVFHAPGPLRPRFPNAPQTFVQPGIDGRYIFSLPTARRILSYRNAIDLIDDETLRRFFRVMLASVVVPVSNIVVSGKGRRYRSNWDDRAADPHKVDRLFRDQVLSALYDLERHQIKARPKARILRGDARLLAKAVEPADLAVFSPPYPNSFDYTDVYNVELWTMGYLDSRNANIRLRNATLRSHIQIARDFSHRPLESASLRSIGGSLQEKRNQLWNRHIPEMVLSYFDDMAKVLRDLARALRPSARAYIVVGDSRYAGIDIPVAAILAELARSCSYKVILRESIRSMRTSPQQGGRAELPEHLLVLERL